jgi:putative Holliday junction resolvase
MRILSLDLGRRRTGIAFADSDVGVPLALDTVVSGNMEELTGQILQLCDEREIDLVVIGLPLLPSGDEGSQSEYVHQIGDRLIETGIEVDYLDERYTTGSLPKDEVDGDASAACELLLMFLQRNPA